MNSSNTCLFNVKSFSIDKLNGYFPDNIEIDLGNIKGINCALLCVKISVPDECIDIMKGYDKYDRYFYGYIPFSQFILNFNYELI
jgi:hypothetical protein